MGKHQRKVDKKLADRIAGYEAIKGDKKAFHKPGSRNLKKQGGGAAQKGFGRR